MFNWHKKGKIFTPDGKYPWMYSHAQCPYPVDFGDFIRVYFCTREKYENGMSKAYGGFVDIDKNDLSKIIYISEEPIMQLGELGEFDEFGSMPGSVIKHNGEYYLYYCGWTRAVSTPYKWEIGLAKSLDGVTFKKVGKGPLIGDTMNEPYLHACPIVYKLAENDWHMFYLSGVRWLEEDQKVESQYVLVHAISKDGMNWERDNTPCLKERVEYESQTSAAVVEMDHIYHMFFSYRCGLNFRTAEGRGYQIGYATSKDLFHWERLDQNAGIALSESGWDSKMIAYPHVTKIHDKYVMFYCGNDFGRDGFGYAELDM